MYRLYWSKGACSMAVHILLEEAGAEFEMEFVSSSGVREGSMTATPEWRATNPKGRIPAFLGVPGRIGGAEGLLTEVPAISYFIAKTYPHAHLMPGDPVGDARCLEWMNFLSCNVHAIAYGQIWRAQRYVTDEAAMPTVQDKGRLNLAEQYRYIESLLTDGRDWAVPCGYSIVDPYLLVFFQWGQRIGIPMRTTYPAWSALTDRLMKRPAVQRVLHKEEIQIL